MLMTGDNKTRPCTFPTFILKEKLIKKSTWTVTSSATQWICMTAEYPAQIIDLCSNITTWASKTRPVLVGLELSHNTNPGDTSSSSMPLSLTFTFSPGPTAVTSSSSDHSWSTTTCVWKEIYVRPLFKHCTKAENLNTIH